MKYPQFFSLFVFFSLVCHAEEPSHPAKDDTSFSVIYDGTDLSQIDTEGNWQIQEDGSLQLTPREGEEGWKRFGSYIWLKQQYSDFVVDFEFKFDAGGNSGFYFRCSDKIDPTKSGFEIQIKDLEDTTKKLGHHDMGGVIKTCGPLVNAAKPAGEWQRMTVSMKGDQLTAVLNGKLIQNFNLREKAPEGKNLAESGWICIQDHGLPFTVRNIRAKKLKTNE